MSKFLFLPFLVIFNLLAVDSTANSTLYAQDDLVTLTTEHSTRIAILDNDEISGKISRIVVTPAKYGKALLNLDNTVTYIPSKEICGKTDSFKYLICNESDCTEATISVRKPCEKLHVLTGFSRNSDVQPNALVIYGLENYGQHHLSIFSPAGNQVYESRNYQNDWTGESNGQPLDEGLYFYIIELDGGIIQEGYVQIDD